MDYSHIERAIELHDEVLHSIQAYQAKYPDSIDRVTERKHDVKAMSLTLLKLIQHINAKFPKPNYSDDEREQVKFMFSGNGVLNAKDFVEKFKDIPPTILESVIPVAIARDLFFNYKISSYVDLYTPFIVKGEDTTPFTIFAATYCELLFAS